MGVAVGLLDRGDAEADRVRDGVGLEAAADGVVFLDGVADTDRVRELLRADGDGLGLPGHTSVSPTWYAVPAQAASPPSSL